MIGITHKCLLATLSLSTLVTSNDLKSDLVEGTYNYDTVDGKFTSYLRELGVGWILRNLAGLARPEVIISKSCAANTPCKWTIATDTMFKDHSVTFALGRPVMDTTMDGRRVESTFELTSNNQLTERQRNVGQSEVTTTLVRDFTQTEMKVRMTAGSVTALGTFKRRV